MALPPLKMQGSSSSSLFDESPNTLASGAKTIGGINNAPKGLLQGSNLFVAAAIALGAVLVFKKIKKV